MKTYLLLILLSPTLSHAFPNQELHDLYERTVRAACYKCSATAAIGSFVGAVMVNGIMLYMMSQAGNNSGDDRPEGH